MLKWGRYNVNLERWRSKGYRGRHGIPNTKNPREEYQINFVSRDTVIFPVIGIFWNMYFNDDKLIKYLIEDLTYCSVKPLLSPGDFLKLMK